LPSAVPTAVPIAAPMAAQTPGRLALTKIMASP
jgi:hypothetical protein